MAGEGNDYVSIRIPDIINAGGTLVAVAEGRYKDSDQAQNDLIVSISKDYGKKWSKPVVAAKGGGPTCNNPCLVYDAVTKNIFLFYQKFPAGVKERDQKPTGWDDPKCIRNFVCYSRNGKSWSKPKDVTSTTKHEDVDIMCSGPNPGVQLTRGEHKGRLVVPMNEGPFGDWTISANYSDNHGKTWKTGQKSAKNGGVNEVSVVETETGGLFMVTRHWSGGAVRKVSYSEDGGETWGPISEHKQLPCTGCQNGLARYSFSDEAEYGNKGRILFSAPSSGRTNGIIKMSYDDGKTWPVSKSVGMGPYAYSALCRLKKGTMGLLFEENGKPLTTIRFTSFSIKWLTDGQDDGMGDSDEESKESKSDKEDGND